MEQNEIVKINNMLLLPPAPELCQVCAVKHDKGDPHDRRSLYYQLCFFETHGRYPTWDDAMRHCDAKTQRAWCKELKKRGIKIK